MARNKSASIVLDRPAPAVAAELVTVDPAELVVGDNVRGDARLDKEFIASLKERGVLIPVTAYRRTEDDRLVVLQGKRRTLGAVRAGLGDIHVVVVPRPDDPDAVIDQVVENDHRTGLTELEHVNAYRQLAGFGLTAAQVAKKLAAPRDQVVAGLAAAKSQTATAALAERPTMTIAQAAVIAEFEDDPGAVKSLLHQVQSGYGFDHQAQRLRDSRARRAAELAAGAALRKAGVRVITSQEGWNAADLDKVKVDGHPATVDNHASCPGHAAWMSDEPDPDATGAASLPRWTPVYVCTEPDRHDDGQTTVDEHLAQAAKERADVEAREAKAFTRDWASATTQRRSWLRGYLARKTAPKGAAAWIAQSMANNYWPIQGDLGTELAFDLLGVHGVKPLTGFEDEISEPMAVLLSGASDGRVTLILLALVLAGFEYAVGEHPGGPVDGAWRTRYLRYLEELGYELSDVELRACGVTPKPDRVTRV